MAVFIHGLIGWAFCAAVMGAGMALFNTLAAMIVHAVLGPAAFALLSLRFHRRNGQAKPAVTALVFTAMVMGLDFFVVSLLILGNLDMFSSFLGFWLPVGLIFGVTWAAGLAARRPVNS